MNNQLTIIWCRYALIVFIMMTTAVCFAQTNVKFIRIVELEINSVHLAKFNAALKEDIETAVKIEPGVISLFAVYDKKIKTQVTIIEIYVSEAAHKSHQQTPHFLKYRDTTKGMVKSVVRKEVLPITPESIPYKN